METDSVHMKSSPFPEWSGFQIWIAIGWLLYSIRCVSKNRSCVLIKFLLDNMSLSHELVLDVYLHSSAAELLYPKTNVCNVHILHLCYADSGVHLTKHAFNEAQYILVYAHQVPGCSWTPEPCAFSLHLFANTLHFSKLTKRALTKSPIIYFLLNYVI